MKELISPETKIAIVFKALLKVILICTILVASFIPILGIFWGMAIITDSMTSADNNDNGNYSTQATEQNQTSLSEDQVKESLDRYIRSSLLSLDYDEQQTEENVYYDSQKYYVFITYNPGKNESTLNISEYTSGGEVLETLNIEPYNLIANQSLRISDFKNYFVFSIDPRDTWCEYDCTEIERTVRRDGAKYGGIWSYNIETGDLRHLYAYTEDEVINYNRYYEYIQSSPLVIIRNTASINGEEISYKIQTLNIVTGELTTIHEDTTL